MKLNTFVANWKLLNALLAMTLAILSCRSALAASAPVPCNPGFPLEAGKRLGWLGADGAYSIPLNNGRDLWIFGDTLYGAQRVVSANIPKMVRNSVGISTCDAGGRWRIRYFIRRDTRGNPVDFFKSQSPGSWYWAMDGFQMGSEIWVTLLCVRSKDPGSAMGFRTCGSDLAQISPQESDPQKWKIVYHRLVKDGAGAYPSATTVIDGSDAYLFALNERGSRPLIAARIPIHGFDDPQQNLEYFATDGHWVRGFDPANARPVMTSGASELSIRYHPELRRWLAVMFAPGPFSQRILLRDAPSATGPWSDGETIYSVPEMKPGTPGYDKDTFCYAAKEHPEFEHNDLVFTYVCNTWAVPKLMTELNIYFPRVVRLTMPEALFVGPK